MNQASTGRRSGTTSVLPAGLALALVTGAGFAAETEQRVVLEEVAVTGTSIKGVAAVGAPAQSVGSEDLQVSGISNTNDALKQLPQFVNLGADEGRGGGVQGAVSNITQAHTVNLRGLGPGATLVLLDGRRMVVNGTQGQFYDLSAIPTNAIGRIEVVTDGASAIYGSEAVAGVVNLITRRDFRGADTALRYESGDGFDRQRFQQNLGLGWDRGSLFVAFEHFEQSGLLGSDRDEVTQDLRPWGGPDLRANFASPGTIVVGTTTYAIPTGQDGRSLTAADFVAGTDNRLDVNESRTLLGDQIRDSVALSLNFDVSDTLALWYAGYYNDRRYRGEGYSLNNGAAVGRTRIHSSCTRARPLQPVCRSTTAT
jgi:iron complex outermembrane receptor protein